MSKNFRDTNYSQKEMDLGKSKENRDSVSFSTAKRYSTVMAEFSLKKGLTDTPEEVQRHFSTILADQADKSTPTGPSYVRFRDPTDSLGDLTETVHEGASSSSDSSSRSNEVFGTTKNECNNNDPATAKPSVCVEEATIITEKPPNTSAEENADLTTPSDASFLTARTALPSRTPAIATTLEEKVQTPNTDSPFSKNSSNGPTRPRVLSFEDSFGTYRSPERSLSLQEPPEQSSTRTYIVNESPNFIYGLGELSQMTPFRHQRKVTLSYGQRRRTCNAKVPYCLSLTTVAIGGILLVASIAGLIVTSLQSTRQPHSNETLEANKNLTDLTESHIQASILNKSTAEAEDMFLDTTTIEAQLLLTPTVNYKTSPPRMQSSTPDYSSKSEIVEGKEDFTLTVHQSSASSPHSLSNISTPPFFIGSSSLEKTSLDQSDTSISDLTYLTTLEMTQSTDDLRSSENLNETKQTLTTSTMRSSENNLTSANELGNANSLSSTSDIETSSYVRATTSRNSEQDSTEIKLQSVKVSPNVSINTSIDFTTTEHRANYYFDTTEQTNIELSNSYSSGAVTKETFSASHTLRPAGHIPSVSEATSRVLPESTTSQISSESSPLASESFKDFDPIIE